LTTFALLYTIDDSLSTSHSTLESTISTLNKISTDTPSLETGTSSTDTEIPMTTGKYFQIIFIDMLASSDFFIVEQSSNILAVSSTKISIFGMTSLVF
jgi:hypothetical protein